MVDRQTLQVLRFTWNDSTCKISNQKATQNSHGSVKKEMKRREALDHKEHECAGESANQSSDAMSTFSEDAEGKDTGKPSSKKADNGEEHIPKRLDCEGGY